MTATTRPLVSICIPTYNSACFLRESLDSILNQTYPNREILVADNASQDDTVPILKEYVDKYDIRLILNETNIGAGANFNLLIENARGEYVAIYHSDDVYAPTIVEESVAVMTARPAVGMVSTMAEAMDSAGNHLYDFVLPEQLACLHKQEYDLHDALIGSLTGGRNRILFITPSVMVRASVYRELGRIDQQAYSFCCDTEMWLRIARTYKVAVIDRKLMKYRIHQNQGSELGIRKHVGIPDIYKVIEEYSRTLDDAVVRKRCAIFLDRTLFKTALKQNCKGLFADSSGTLQKITGNRYRLLGSVLRCANLLRLNLHIWP